MNACIPEMWAKAALEMLIDLDRIRLDFTAPTPAIEHSATCEVWSKLTALDTFIPGVK